MKTKRKPKISIIACVAKNRGIGKNNRLLFDIPEDLKHFKKITLGHPIIMGYNTYKSLGRPLPGRLNIVLLDDNHLKIKGCEEAHSIREAIEIGSKKDSKEIFFIGGGMVYREAIKIADKLYLTVVDASPPADTFFPKYSVFKKIILKENKKQKDLKYKFIELERI